MSRVLLVGLDGASWDILRPLARDGRLPNLQKMIDKGATGILESTVPPVTPAAWTSVFTGKNPGRHGIFDFQKLDRAHYEFGTIYAHRHREKKIWDILGEVDKRSIIVDVPFTYPPMPLNGLMLTGYGTPRTPGTVFTYPEDLSTLVPPRLHEQLRVALPQNRFERSAGFIEEWLEIMDGRRAFLQYLAREHEWDFFMTVFSITDNMAHVFWTFADPAHPNFYRPEAEQYREAFYASYERCDELLGALMEIAGPRTTTVVISDHGFGSVRPRQYLFQRLLEGGYLQVANRRDKQGGLREWILKAAVRTYSRFPIIREWVKALSPGRRRSLQRTLHKAGAMPDRSAVDHAASKVILSDFGLQIWINEVGRFPHGIIRKEARAKFIEDLVDFLLSDRDPVTGERIVERVHLGRDVYEGPYVDDCPDLIVEYKNHFGMAGTSGRRNGFTEGGHTHDGIFLASGPAIANHNAGNAHLMDLAPTILYLLGLAVPKDMDGRMLEEIFSERFLRDNPLQMSQQAAVFEEILPGTPYSDEQDAELRNQLRQLGYL